MTRGASVEGILCGGVVTIVDVKWIGTAASEVTYKHAAGRFGNESLYWDREPTVDVVTVGACGSFDGGRFLSWLID